MTCGHSRYKPRTGMGKTLVAYKKLRYFLITPRLQRLFMSPRTAEHMTWHQAHDTVDGVMVYPSNSEAWKRFNSVHPDFSAKSRNVRLGLCTDGFNPFRPFAAPYSCWPVILTIYNLPPECVWGRSSCFYLLSYPVQEARGGIVTTPIFLLVYPLIFPPIKGRWSKFFFFLLAEISNEISNEISAESPLDREIPSYRQCTLHTFRITSHPQSHPCLAQSIA